MPRYEIYRTTQVEDKCIDVLIAIAFSEPTADEIVESIRKTQGNQLCYFKAVA